MKESMKKSKLHDKREEIFKRGMNYWYDELMN